MKKLPLGAVVAADLLIFLLSMAVFCYFHHIRDLWFAPADEAVGMTPVETLPAESVEPTLPEQPEKGDFEDAFPGVFLTTGTPFLSEQSAVIQRYLSDNALPGPDIDDLTYKTMQYVGLYHSDNIFLTATEIHKDIKSSGKTYDLTFHLYDVYVKNIENLFTVAVSGERMPIDELSGTSYEITGKDGEAFITSPAVFALNGDYFGNDNLVKYAVRNGHLLRGEEDVGADLCVLYYDGTVETLTAKKFNAARVQAKKPYQIWEFGPNLLDSEGNALSDYDPSHYGANVLTNRHPRAAFGYYEPGHYCFVLVDGRSDQSDGLRITQLADLMDQLDCPIAYNLDGGDSAQSIFNGKRHRVDEDREQTGEGQRDLYDIICIGEVTKK